MALMTCPDCGKEISDQEPGCPNCGRPTAPLTDSSMHDVSMHVCGPEDDFKHPEFELKLRPNWKRRAAYERLKEFLKRLLARSSSR